MKNDPLKIEASERLVWLRPDNDEIRFSLAYAHAQAGNEDMALHHYLAIPHSKRKSHTWNNLGVSYQHFSISGRSIEAFERAAAGGNSLARSNLAYRYLHAGFLKEAKEQLDQALSEKEPHKNANEAYALLTSTPEVETQKLDDALGAVAHKASFL